MLRSARVEDVFLGPQYFSYVAKGIASKTTLDAKTTHTDIFRAFAENQGDAFSSTFYLCSFKPVIDHGKFQRAYHEKYVTDMFADMHIVIGDDPLIEESDDDSDDM